MADETPKTEAEAKVAIYEKYLGAIARQDDKDMYDGPMFDDILANMSRQAWAQKALSLADADIELQKYSQRLTAA